MQGSGSVGPLPWHGVLIPRVRSRPPTTCDLIC
jgi:hypothetical protein